MLAKKLNLSPEQISVHNKNLQEIQRSEGDIKQYYEDAMSKIGTV